MALLGFSVDDIVLQAQGVSDILKLPRLKLSQCSGLVLEERLGAEATISYEWIG